MTRYKVYEVIERTTQKGDTLKKLVLQGEGKQYPDKNVTMWNDHPLFETIAAGQEIEADIQVRDSNTPNPRGGFYKDKTLLRPGQQPLQPKTNVTPYASPDRLFNVLQLEVIPRLDRILAWQDRRDVLDGIEPAKKDPVGLDPDKIESAFNGAGDEDIMNSSPF